MSLFKIFDVSGSALSAQSVRLNTIASNLANANDISATPQGAYRARHPVFAAVLSEAGGTPTRGVRVAGIVESNTPPLVEHRPGHPLADENGNVYVSSVNAIQEMTDMISAESTYQNNVEVLNTVRQLMLRTLQIGGR